MKPCSAAVLGAILVLPCAAAASAAALVAPAYPGAVQGHATADAVVYLTKDEASAVRGFYAGHGVTLVDGDKLLIAPEAASALPDAQNRLSADVMDRKAICAAKKKAGSHAPESMVDGPEAAGVAIGWNAPPKSVDVVPDKTSVFSGFASEVTAGRHSKAEYAALYGKYGWLETAFYPSHKDADGTASYDHWLVQKTWDRLQAPQEQGMEAGEQQGQSAAALAKKIQAAAAQGNMAEMQRLSQQMMVAQRGGMAAGQTVMAAQKKDEWKTWMGVLKQLEAHAYRTAIAIDMNPGVWPLTNDCGR